MSVISALAAWFERNPVRVLLIPVLFLIIFYVLPLAIVVVTSVLSTGDFTLSAYVKLLNSSTFIYTILRTIRLSLLVTLFCLVLGYPYPYALTKVDGLSRRLLIFAVLLPFFTSILVRSYAWVSILGPSGPVNQLLINAGIIQAPISLVYNEIGALIGMTQVQLPLMILTLYGAMRRIDSDLMRAAEILGAHRLVAFLKIYLPLSWPGVVSGLGLVFTTTLGFYVTPALLGGPSNYMVTQSIYLQLNQLADFGGTAAQATVLLLIVLMLLFLLRHAISLRESRAVGERSSSLHWLAMSSGPEYLASRLGHAADWVLATLRVLRFSIVAFSVVFLSVTLVAVILLGLSSDDYLRLPPTGYSLRWVKAYLGDPQWVSSTYFSLWISVLGALLGVILGSLGAYGMVRWEHRTKSTTEIFLISPMIIPSFVIALALYFVFVKLGVLNNPLTYVFTYGVFNFPTAFLVMYAAFQRFDFSLVQAGAILGATPFSIWRRIVIPILLPSFLTAWVFSFLSAFDDLVGALFFSSGGNYTLTMRMWADIRFEISPKVAAVAVVFFTIALVVFVVLSIVGFVRQRLARRALLRLDLVRPNHDTHVIAPGGYKNAI